MKRSGLTAVAAFLLTGILCACGAGGGTSTTTAPQTFEAKAPETEARKEVKEETSRFTFEGKYTFYGSQDLDSGKVELAKDNDIDAALILRKGGTGTGVSYGNEFDITSWETSDEYVTINIDDGSTIFYGWFEDGILYLSEEEDENTLNIFAQDGADTSYYDELAAEEGLSGEEEGQRSGSRVSALAQSMDSSAGIHISWQYSTEPFDEVTDCEAQYRDNGTKDFYMDLISPGFRETYCFSDGALYEIYPETLAGGVTDTDTSMLQDDLMLYAEPYRQICSKEGYTDYTEETREIDGVTYVAEVFPGEEFVPQAAFLFTDDGELAYILIDEPEDPEDPSPARDIYKLNAIDSVIDESLFDLSEYELVT